MIARLGSSDRIGMPKSESEARRPLQKVVRSQNLPQRVSRERHTLSGSLKPLRQRPVFPRPSAFRPIAEAVEEEHALSDLAFCDPFISRVSLGDASGAADDGRRTGFLEKARFRPV